MTTRAAIYARFSSEQQNERSCQDQIDMCRVWAERQGLAVVDTFRDEAISGASTINRLGLAQLLRAAKLGQFNVLVCEDLDRISRKQADLHRIRDELTFLGISIMTVSDGIVTAMSAGLKGLMSEMFLTDLANKTRRGLRARVSAGASGGGKSYGYDTVPGKPGEHTINQREAAIVLRIFKEYLGGTAPRSIAGRLNADRIAGPRGGKWNSSTINGSKSRQNGILQNRLYVGEIVWNRQRFIKDPASGKRVSRPNPESEWMRVNAPELTIVPLDLFDAVAARKETRTFVKTPAPMKPKHLLSGLIKCGCCGASYTVIGRDRLGCAGFRERKDCTNNRTVERSHIEGRVLKALQERLANADMMSEYVKAYHEERRAFAAAARADRGGKERRLGELTRGIKRIVDMLVDGTASTALMARLSEMEAEQENIHEELAAADADESTVALHPAAANRYRQIVSDLQAHLDGMQDGAPSTAVLEQAQKLIDRVVITPRNSKEPVDLTVYGLLAELFIGPSGHPDVGGRWLRGRDHTESCMQRYIFRLSPHDSTLYRQRHKIESMFGRLKDWRIHTRCDRYAHTFMSAISIAATVIVWLGSTRTEPRCLAAFGKYGGEEVRQTIARHHSSLTEKSNDSSILLPTGLRHSSPSYTLMTQFDGGWKWGSMARSISCRISNAAHQS
jgi:DNA invertase Pin-like site-specific DNA recombinase